MSDRMCRVSVDCPSVLLADLIAILVDKRLANIKVDPVAEPATERAPRKEMQYANGKRWKGISGQNLVLQALRQCSPLTHEQLKSIFVAHEFAASSVSPALNIEVKEGRVQRTADGAFALVAGQ